MLLLQAKRAKFTDKFKDVIRLLDGCEIYLCYGSESEKQGLRRSFQAPKQNCLKN
ncbi:hypothetical protein QM027_04155 [Campylobacter concisus]